MGKYKVGDKVRIVSEWVDGCCQNRDGKMDKWLGKIMTIRHIRPYCIYMKEDFEENYSGWVWSEKCIAEKVGEDSSYPTCKACKYTCSCCISRGDASKCYNCIDDHSDFKPAENIKHCHITGLQIMENQYTRCKHMKDNGNCSKRTSNSGYCKYPCSYYECIDDI